MLFQGGVFLDAADNLHVHGTDDDDLITIADDEITIDTLNGSPFAVDLTEAAAVHVWRTPATTKCPPIPKSPRP